MRNGLDIDRYWETLAGALPTFTDEQRHAAIALYRTLAQGTPVTAEAFAHGAGLSVGRAEELLDSDPIRALVYVDESGRVAGFGGLATSPMHHELQLAGRTLWTWCAWDSLFLPEILGEGAVVVSRDPRSGAEIRLSVGPDGVRARDPETTIVSFVRTDSSHFRGSAANVMGSFCHYVFFFENHASGEAWIESHDGTFLVSLDEAADLAHRMNRRTWGDALRAAAPKIELVYFEGCPNAPRARDNLRVVLEAMGAEVSWREWDLLSDSTPAELRAFGSPTVLIDGADVTGVGGSGNGVACRADGAPSIGQIAAKLGRREARGA